MMTPRSASLSVWRHREPLRDFAVWHTGGSTYRGFDNYLRSRFQCACRTTPRDLAFDLNLPQLETLDLNGSRFFTASISTLAFALVSDHHVFPFRKHNFGDPARIPLP